MWSIISLFLLPTMKKVKNWHPYDIGDMSYYLFHAYNVPFGFLEPCWQVGSNNYTFKFCSLSRLQNWGTCVREGQLIQGAQNTAKLTRIPNIGDFFLPKNRWILYDFVMLHWMSKFLSPFLPHLNSVLHIIFFTTFI